MNTKNTTLSSEQKYRIEHYKLNYRANIPFYILLDSDLIVNELRLYGLIEQMESCLSDVYMSDRSFSEILGVDHEGGMIRRMARKLRKKNYIKREQREVIIKGKSHLKYCWNTVKGGVIIEDCENNKELNPVLPVPPHPVLPVPPPPVLPVPPYIKEVSSKALDNNVCEISPKNLTNTESKEITQTFLSIGCLQDDKCKRIFEKRFSNHDVTIEEILEGCVMYYALKEQPQKVSYDRFRKWLRNENPENYDKKEKDVQLKVFKDLTEEQKQLVQDYNHRIKNPDLTKNWPSLTLTQIKDAKYFIAILKGSAGFMNVKL